MVSMFLSCGHAMSQIQIVFFCFSSDVKSGRLDVVVVIIIIIVSQPEQCYEQAFALYPWPSCGMGRKNPLSFNILIIVALVTFGQRPRVSG